MKDTDSKKVNLSIGAYRDNDGKPWILPSVKEVSCRVTIRRNVEFWTKTTTTSTYQFQETLFSYLKEQDFSLEKTS